MASFVVRIDDLNAVLTAWDSLTAAAGVSPIWTLNEDVLVTLGIGQWERIRWLYYCDDYEGCTLRVYDTEHFAAFGNSHYLESDGHSQGHYERVVLRGQHLWSREHLALRGQFRMQTPWYRVSARAAPNRPNGTTTTDIQGGMCRQTRIEYFEAVNQPPVFQPEQHVPPSLIELVRAARARRLGQCGQFCPTCCAPGNRMPCCLPVGHAEVCACSAHQLAS